MALVLPEEVVEHVNGAVLAGAPMLLATVDEAGKPRLSFRGSTQVFSPDQLGFWARNVEGASLGAIKTNPHVAMMYRHPTKRTFLQFSGQARVAQGQERDRVFDSAPEIERKADPERKGVGVIIDLDKVEGLLGFDADGKPRRLSMTRD